MDEIIIRRRKIDIGFTEQPPPLHEWDGTKVRFKLPDGEWGEWVEVAISDVVVSKASYLEFPTIGKDGTIYIDIEANATYRWDGDNLKYYCVGRDYKEIEIINGGNL